MLRSGLLVLSFVSALVSLDGVPVAIESAAGRAENVRRPKSGRSLDNIVLFRMPLHTWNIDPATRPQETKVTEVQLAGDCRRRYHFGNTHDREYILRTPRHYHPLQVSAKLQS